MECLQFEVLFQPMYRSVNCVVMDDGELVNCKDWDSARQQLMLRVRSDCHSDHGTCSSVVKVLALHWDGDSPYAVTCHTDLSVAANVLDSHHDSLLVLVVDYKVQHHFHRWDTSFHSLDRKSSLEHTLRLVLVRQIDRLLVVQILQIHTAVLLIP